MWKKALIFALFLFPSLSFAQTDEEFQRTPPGTKRVLLENARSIVQAGKDTTGGVFVAGVDQWAWYIKYTSVNDSINVKVFLDLSADNQNWKTWSLAAVDSSKISGTADRDTLFNFTNPPNYAMYARVRLLGAHAAGDSVNMTVKWVLTWLPVAINP